MRSALLPAGLAFVAVIVSTIPRILLAANALPGALRPLVWSDPFFLYQERLAGGRVPYVDTFFEYPPVIGYISAALVSLDGVTFVAMWGLVCAAAASVVAFVLARISGMRAGLFWSLSPQLLLYGAMNFDAVALAPLVLAIAGGRADRPVATMVLLALGTATKVFPLLAVPFEARRTGTRRGRGVAILGLAVFAVVTLALALPTLITRYPLTSSVAYVGARVNYDSIWGLILTAATSVPFIDTVALVVSAAGTLATYAWVWRRTRGGDATHAIALGLLGVLLWARLYSPQYSLWLVPFFALGALSLRAFALLCVADLVVFVTVYPLGLIHWGTDETIPGILYGLLAGGIVFRHAALIVAFRDGMRPAVSSAMTR